MDSNILFEISKYVYSSSGIDRLHKVLSSKESCRRRREDISGFLTKKLQNRPTLNELKNRNIIQKRSFSFSEIHKVLKKIDFTNRENCKVAPIIANKMNDLEFFLKQKIIERKFHKNKDL